MKVKPTLFKKIQGINLLILMISSSIGVFIIATIIRGSFNINTNYLITQAIEELDGSARSLEKILTQIFTANGYGTDVNYSTEYKIETQTTFTKIAVSYNAGTASLGGGLDDAIDCLGKIIQTDQTLTISFKKADSSQSGQLLCTATSIGAASAIQTNIPLIDQQQIVNFYIVAIGKTENNFKNYPLTLELLNTYKNFLTTNKSNAYGIKLAIILRSSNPVFNKNRSSSFSNILSIPTFEFTANDKFLYKLVILQLPFIHANKSANSIVFNTT